MLRLSEANIQLSADNERLQHGPAGASPSHEGGGRMEGETLCSPRIAHHADIDDSPEL